MGMRVHEARQDQMLAMVVAGQSGMGGA